MGDVFIVDTGVANIASMLAALRRAGARPRLTTRPDEVAAAEYLVLPGVGAFRAGMEALRRHGLISPLRERLQAGRPTLAVCLGLQFLCQGSEEADGVAGLGIVDGVVERFDGEVRVPQPGWNRLEPAADSRLLEGGYAYFANSYRLRTPPTGWKVAQSDYSGPFVAAMERDGVLACQFHPELSGAFGRELIERWLQPAADSTRDVSQGGSSC